ncbi:MAG: PAS domain S-box protein [Pedobacter sp.]
MSDPSDLILHVSTSGGASPRAITDLPIAVAVADKNRSLLHANQAFCDYLGYLPAELQGMSIDAITHPDDLDQTASVFHLLQLGEEPSHTYEKRYVCKNGSVVWCLTTVNRVATDATANSPLFLGFIHDISPQKHTEEKLRAAKLLYKALVENLGVGLALIDRDHRIKMVNSSLASMFGKVPEYFIGKSCFRALEGRPSICRHCPGVKAMASGQPHTVITEGVRENGDQFKVQLKAFPVFDKEGICTGFVELAEDMTPHFQMKMALEESEERFKALAETTPIGIFELSPEGQNTYSNPAWMRMTGLTAEESLGLGWTATIPPEEREGVVKRWQNGRQLQGPWQQERRLLHRNGEMRWVQASAVPLYDSKGNLTRYVGSMVDLTEQKQAMEKLSESEERFRSIFEKSGVGMKVIAKNGRIMDANPAFCSLLGYSLDELKAGKVQRLFHPDDADQPCQLLAAMGNNESQVTFLRRFLRKDGAAVWAEVTGVWVPGGPDGQGFGVGIIQDITDKKEAQARLEYLAYHDELTGLPNRTLLLDRLKQSLHYVSRSGRLVAVVLLNIDRFKLITDTLGHASGDRLLCAIAEHLQQAVREGDTVARMEGDEFAILLTDIADEDDVRLVTNKILRHLSKPFEIDAHKITLTASLGISLYPRDSDDVENLLRHADLALGRAKKGGGNLVAFYSPAMNLRAQYALELESGLRQALKRGEFCLYYQPKVSLKSGQIIGCEALIRWDCPQRGMVPPTEFIPLAEETGLIIPIGNWVLKEACRQNKAWQDAGLPAQRVAVNLSARQLRKNELATRIRKILMETRLQPHLLELELTESMLMDDPDQAVSLMTGLKQLGIHLSLDDFGTGYSSLAYLSRFPIDCLKIDRSFINNITTDPDAAMIATSIIALGHRMRLKVVAEGVETEAQLGYLKQNGCDEIQGFYFSEPVSGEAFAALLHEGKSLDGVAEGPDKPTILIVDDEPHILYALQRLLLEDDYRVLTAASPLEGFEILAQNEVQVLISGQCMPNMRGTEFLRRVKAMYPETVRLILSGYADLPTVMEAINECMPYRFLTKPWDNNYLRAQIREAFDFYTTQEF